ncbi:hypothetical protein MUP65_00190 [Patescibacteria group bacterium]|nr:hypothetical protein [Patescibacteria group bacterium]
MLKAFVLTPQKKDPPSRLRRSLVVEALGDLKVELLNPIPGRPPKKSRVFYPPLFPGISFDQEAALLKKADFLIADLSGADFRAGFLISEALKIGKPVLGLFWDQLDRESVSDWRGEKSFYLECVNKDNARSILRKFLRYLKRQRMSWGKMVVFDGTDGSGKATQIDLLGQYLTKKKINFKMIDFPRYETSFYGEMVGEFLRGEYGSFEKIDPRLTAVLYASDRLLAREQLYDWLKAGNLVIANRYVSASLGHHTARLPVEKREEFVNWLLEMEYRVNRLPKEDLVVFLHVPVEMSRKLIEKKPVRKYLKGEKKDAAEKSVNHQLESEKVFLQLVAKFDHWEKVVCLDAAKKLLSPEKIHPRVVRLLQNYQIIES